MGAAGAEAVEDLRHRDVRGRFRRLLAHVLLCFGRQMVVVTMLYRSSGLFLCFFLSLNAATTTTTTITFVIFCRLFDPFDRTRDSTLLAV
ncbi:hypothetical protein B296_00048278 [Ensete ventricosum]|uniref:Uncharacterized protein n=1 Tax=Ensete ventricosum TaxID=4639 RepID=A0A426XDB1_ENSVE|nr:hypothetical protein B296_00048278 [Ensete ventricosum]